MLNPYTYNPMHIVNHYPIETVISWLAVGCIAGLAYFVCRLINRS